MKQPVDLTGPLYTALDEEDHTRVQSILNIMQPDVGVSYLIKALQDYCVNRHATNGVVNQTSADIVIDLLQGLWESEKTLADANYIAPNLSPEVSALLLFSSGEMVKEGLKSGSPNWYMVPSSTWLKFLELAKGACDRHAAEQVEAASRCNVTPAEAAA